MKFFIDTANLEQIREANALKGDIYTTGKRVDEEVSE